MNLFKLWWLTIEFFKNIFIFIHYTNYLENIILLYGRSHTNMYQ
jgi:hypothetical protein